MADTEATPGPWRAVGNSIQAGSVATGDHQIIAECWDSEGKAGANAKAIAAMPELLYALRAAVRALGPGVPPAQIEAALIVALAAVEKAGARP